MSGAEAAALGNRGSPGPGSSPTRAGSESAAWAQPSWPCEVLGSRPGLAEALPAREVLWGPGGGKELLGCLSYAQGVDGGSLIFYTSLSIIIKFPVAVNLLKSYLNFFLVFCSYLKFNFIC